MLRLAHNFSFPTNYTELNYLNLISLDENNISFENAIRIVVPIAFTLILFLGFIGNTLVIVAILSRKEMQNSTYLLIGNLAVADLLLLVFCMPYQAVIYALSIWPFLNGWCSITPYLQNVAVSVSGWTLTLIAFDRYLAVVFPIQSLRFRSRRNAAISVIIFWGIFLLANIPVITDFQVMEYLDKNKRKVSQCVFIDVVTNKATELFVKTYISFWIVFIYVLPLTTTCILYLCVLWKLWRKVSNDGTRLNHDHLETARKVTHLVAAVTITFAISWLPIYICYLYMAFTYKQHQRTAIHVEYLILEILSKLLAFANSCANPLLYTFLSNNFRKGFSQVWHCCLSKNERFAHGIAKQNEMLISMTTTNDSAKNDFISDEARIINEHVSSV